MIGEAPAKLNLALVVGGLRPDGRHDVLTVLQRLDLADSISVEPAQSTTVAGFANDTLVRRALDSLAAPHGWRAVIGKRIPVAAGLGGGSSDAATALRLANAQLEQPLTAEALHELAAGLGADVPFFLRDGPQLGSGDGTTLEPVSIPPGFAVLLVLPHSTVKTSTRDVYAAYDARRGGSGFEERARAVRSERRAPTGRPGPGPTAAERPGDVAAHRAARGSGRLPGRRERRRPDRLRPVRRRRRRRARAGRRGGDRRDLDRQSCVVG